MGKPKPMESVMMTVVQQLATAYLHREPERRAATPCQCPSCSFAERYAAGYSSGELWGGPPPDAEVRPRRPENALGGWYPWKT